MKELRTEIEIHAAPEKVWGILTDLSRWSEWNPSFKVVGKAEPGESVALSFPSGKGEMTLHCKVCVYEPNKKLAWQYHVGLPFLFRGEHSFTIEPAGEGRVRFIDIEVFNGLLVPLQAKDIDTNTRRSFEQMDQALKARAEQ